MIIKVRIEGFLYEVEIKDLNSLPVIARIGNEFFEVWPEEKELIQVKSHRVMFDEYPGLLSNSRDRIVLSPLPGVISEIHIKPGSFVRKGAPLLVIDAMKMKNKIHAGRNGTVSTIHIQVGDQVKHNQALIEFAEQES
jgi:biotin carboxyl carrier protein